MIVTREEIKRVTDNIASVLAEKEQSYGGSWQKRGGIGAFMMLARKWDRVEKQCQQFNFNVFAALEDPQYAESVDDDLRDLIGYCVLVLARHARNTATLIPRLARPVEERCMHKPECCLKRGHEGVCCNSMGIAMLEAVAPRAPRVPRRDEPIDEEWCGIGHCKLVLGHAGAHDTMPGFGGDTIPARDDDPVHPQEEALGRQARLGAAERSSMRLAENEDDCCTHNSCLRVRGHGGAHLLSDGTTEQE